MQELAADERAFLDGHALDTEVVAAAVEQNVLDLDSPDVSFDFAQMFLPWAEAGEFEDFSGSVNAESVFDRFLDNFTSWKPSGSEVLNFVFEFFADVNFCLVEKFVDLVVGFVFGPARVEGLNAVREMSVDAVPWLAIKLRNSVVDSIDFLDQTLVDFDENCRQLLWSEFHVFQLLQQVSDDTFAVVHVDQASGTQSER